MKSESKKTTCKGKNLDRLNQLIDEAIREVEHLKRDHQIFQLKCKIAVEKKMKKPGCEGKIAQYYSEIMNLAQ